MRWKARLLARGKLPKHIAQAYLNEMGARAPAFAQCVLLGEALITRTGTRLTLCARPGQLLDASIRFRNLVYRVRELQAETRVFALMKDVRR